MSKVYLKDAKEFSNRSITYRKILEHRNNCEKWTKEFCLDCFGGGLTQFTKNLEEEYYKNRWVDNSKGKPEAELNDAEQKQNE